MKHRLYSKFLLGYLLFGILSFLVIAFFSASLTRAFLLKKSGEALYGEASVLAEECALTYTNGAPDLVSLESEMKIVADTLDSSIWIIDRQGLILYDSQDQQTGVQIAAFNPTDGGQGHYHVSRFYDLFSSDVISAYAPIAGYYQIYGYVYFHQSLSSALASTDSILNVVYITGLILFLLSLILLVVFHFIVYRPLRQITVAAGKYAEGDLSYRSHLNTEDEMGYLSNTLNYMASELAKTEEYQHKFISNVSHDFRSPLTTIRGYLEAMIDGTIPPELYEKYMRLVISETDRLAKLTQNTLTLQTLETRGAYLELTNFDINEVIKNTAAAFEGACRPKDISFDLIVSAPTLMVWADMSKIQQVLYNLIDNAIKFSNPHSTIRLETSTRYDKAFVSVRDSGIGIPKESQKKIWDRFYKTDLSRGKDKKGTGLGLSIVKEIIQAHGENIDVISTVGVGTEFIFTLATTHSQS
jgi:signal transduction histidine kinase